METKVFFSPIKFESNIYKIEDYLPDWVCSFNIDNNGDPKMEELSWRFHFCQTKMKFKFDSDGNDGNVNQRVKMVETVRGAVEWERGQWGFEKI